MRTFLISGGKGPDGGSPLVLAKEVLRGGGTPVLSVPLAGRGREEVLDDLKAFHAAGVRDLLAVSGDFPAGARGGAGGAAFDLDSVQLLLLLGRLAGPGEEHLRDFSAGCVVSPFKYLESELIWQYEKLEAKLAAGAAFVVSQAGFDVRKCDELLRFCRLRGLGGPLLANLLVPDPATAAALAAGAVPGVSLPRELLERLGGREAAGGKGARLLAAGRTLAVLRGLGYGGVLLGGDLEHGDVLSVLDTAERFRHRWEDCLDEAASPRGGFYYFRPGDRPGLNADAPAPLRPKGRPHPMYLLSAAVDYVAFGSWRPFFLLLYRVCSFCDRHPFWAAVLRAAEHLSKAPVYGCRMCGDCTLYACGFLCCESLCPKRILNGPCGGSREGWCEVSPGRERCVWVTVYERLKGVTPRPSLHRPPVPPRDRSLDGTCSWINFCLGRDHRRMKRP